MPEQFEIHGSRPADLGALEALYPDAFPDEDLLPLVKQLLAEEAGVLSLVAMAGDDLVGHCIFTACIIESTAHQVSLLGPLAVTPARQRQGVGSALVRAGLHRVEAAGAVQANVLGDPAYYGRFGFSADDRVAPPYPLPKEWCGAWQSIVLRNVEPPCSGRLSVPEPWRRPVLWGP